MMEWWGDLSAVNQVFFLAATFFSAIFLWQFIASLIGLGHGDVDVAVDADIDVDADVDLDSVEAHSLGEAGESFAAFKFLSIRAILAFCTLFSWAGGLYLNTETPLNRALLYALVWGLAGWLAVSVLIHWMRGLAETGTAQLSSCLNTTGTVYLNIPAAGAGEVRVTVGGAVTMVKARSDDGESIEAGEPIRVVGVLDATTVQVRPLGSQETAKEREG